MRPILVFILCFGIPMDARSCDVTDGTRVSELIAEPPGKIFLSSGVTTESGECRFDALVVSERVILKEQSAFDCVSIGRRFLFAEASDGLRVTAELPFAGVSADCDSTFNPDKLVQMPRNLRPAEIGRLLRRLDDVVTQMSQDEGHQYDERLRSVVRTGTLTMIMENYNFRRPWVAEFCTDICVGVAFSDEKSGPPPTLHAILP